MANSRFDFAIAKLVAMLKRMLLAAGLFGCIQGSAWGAGLAIMEQSVKELGQAFSGATTNTEDGSSIYFNPGAMARIHGRMLSLAGYVVIPSSSFADQGSRLSPSVGGAPLRGNNGGDAAVTSLIPNVYYVQQLTDKLVVGLGVNVPFGSHNAYRSDWQGRYQTLSSDLKTLSFYPAMGFRITDQISIGAGLNVQYLRASLTNAIDFGTICLQALGPVPCSAGGLLPQQADGRVRLEGDSVGLGYDLGVLFIPHPDLRVGAGYRSRVRHNVEGTADFAVPAAATPLTGGTLFSDTRAKTLTILPDSVSFGFSQRLGSQWSISGDALWTHWSLVRELRTQFASAQPDSVQRLDWQDTWRYALGVSFKHDANWTFRSGLAYDQTPIPNARRRNPRIPDSDRIWLTLGVSFRYFDSLTLQAAYAHLFFADASIDSVGATGDRLTGRVEQQTDILGLQLDWRF